METSSRLPLRTRAACSRKESRRSPVCCQYSSSSSSKSSYTHSIINEFSHQLRPTREETERSRRATADAHLAICSVARRRLRCLVGRTAFDARFFGLRAGLRACRGGCCTFAVDQPLVELFQRHTFSFRLRDKHVCGLASRLDSPQHKPSRGVKRNFVAREAAPPSSWQQTWLAATESAITWVSRSVSHHSPGGCSFSSGRSVPAAVSDGGGNVLAAGRFLVCPADTFDVAPSLLTAAVGAPSLRRCHPCRQDKQQTSCCHVCA